MRRVTIRRSQSTIADLWRACDELGIGWGDDFCIVPASEFEGQIGDVGPHNNTVTSRAAAYANLPRRDSQRYVVLECIVDGGHHGYTRDELADVLRSTNQTITPRVWELVKGGFVEETARTRRTRQGQQAKVLVATPKARDQVLS